MISGNVLFVCLYIYVVIPDLTREQVSDCVRDGVGHVGDGGEEGVARTLAPEGAHYGVPGQKQTIKKVTKISKTKFENSQKVHVQKKKKKSPREES